VSIYRGYIGKIFGTELSAVAATYIYWRLPGLGSRAAVTKAHRKYSIVWFGRPVWPSVWGRKAVERR
jgi:hypothetical protein